MKTLVVEGEANIKKDDLIIDNCSLRYTMELLQLTGKKVKITVEWK